VTSPIADRQHSSTFGILAEELIVAGSGFRFRARGLSMLPAIRDDEIVHVAPVESGGIKMGDILLFRHNGQFKAHRMMRKDGEFFVTRGDTGKQIDGRIHRGQVLGRVTAKECGTTGRLVRLDTRAARARFALSELRRALDRRSKLPPAAN
jgi:L-rhamnose isomerase